MVISFFENKNNDINAAILKDFLVHTLIDMNYLNQDLNQIIITDDS